MFRGRLRQQASSGAYDGSDQRVWKESACQTHAPSFLMDFQKQGPHGERSSQGRQSFIHSANTDLSALDEPDPAVTAARGLPSITPGPGGVVPAPNAGARAPPPPPPEAPAPGGSPGPSAHLVPGLRREGGRWSRRQLRPGRRRCGRGRRRFPSRCGRTRGPP